MQLPSFPFEENPKDRRNSLKVYTGKDGARVVSRRPQVTLLLLSGGIDSTYVLAKLLRECDDTVLAHRVNLITAENRNAAEAAACKKIVAYCRENIREFHFTESTIDHSGFSNLTRDSYLGSIEAGLAASSYLLDNGWLVDRWTIGNCWEEIKRNGVEAQVRHISIIEQLFALTYAQDHTPRYFQLPLKTKADQMAYLGNELANQCWYCRTPLYASEGNASPCGKCMTCEVVRQAKSQLISV